VHKQPLAATVMALLHSTAMLSVAPAAKHVALSAGVYCSITNRRTIAALLFAPSITLTLILLQYATIYCRDYMYRC
jgi:hypothetical protein